jgi:hypothetical protein
MQTTQLSYPSSYSQEEIQKILELALSRKIEQDELTREQLWEIGSELGINQESLQKAEQDWLNQKVIASQHLEFDQYRRECLKHKAVRYIIVNSFIISLDWLTTNNISLSLYIVLIWGLILSLETWKTFNKSGEQYEKAFQSWRLRQDLKTSLQTVWDKIRQTWQS